MNVRIKENHFVNTAHVKEVTIRTRKIRARTVIVHDVTIELEGKTIKERFSKLDDAKALWHLLYHQKKT